MADQTPPETTTPAASKPKGKAQGRPEMIVFNATRGIRQAVSGRPGTPKPDGTPTTELATCRLLPGLCLVEADLFELTESAIEETEGLTILSPSLDTLPVQTAIVYVKATGSTEVLATLGRRVKSEKLAAAIAAQLVDIAKGDKAAIRAQAAHTPAA